MRRRTITPETLLGDFARAEAKTPAYRD